MNIVIFGLGALGTVYATFPKAVGHTVYAVTRKHDLKNLKQGKVRVSGIWGNREAILDGVFGGIGRAICIIE
jgi:2-dehydropantoate 2-reductase